MAADGGSSKVTSGSPWEQGDGPISNIPDSLLLEVFTRVEDAKSLVFCSCVCKSWYRKVRDVEHVTIISPRHFKTYWDKIMDVVDKVNMFPSLVTLRVRFGCAADNIGRPSSNGSLSSADESATSLPRSTSDSSLPEERSGSDWRQRVQQENEEQWKRCLRYAELGSSVDKFIFLAARAAHPAIFRCAMTDTPPAAEISRRTAGQPSASSPQSGPVSPSGLTPRAGRLSLSDWHQDETLVRTTSPFGEVTESFYANSAQTSAAREPPASLGSPATRVTHHPPPPDTTAPLLTTAAAATGAVTATPFPRHSPPADAAGDGAGAGAGVGVASAIAADGTAVAGLADAGDDEPISEEPLTEEPSPAPFSSPEGGLQVHLRQVMGPRDDSLRRMMPVIVFAIIRCFDELRDVLPCLLLRLPRLSHLLLVDPSDNVTINVRPHHVRQLRAGKAGMGLAGDEDATSAAASATSSLATSVLETAGEAEADAQGDPLTTTSAAAAREPEAQTGFERGSTDDDAATEASESDAAAVAAAGYLRGGGADGCSNDANEVGPHGSGTAAHAGSSADASRASGAAAGSAVAPSAATAEANRLCVSPPPAAGSSSAPCAPSADPSCVRFLPSTSDATAGATTSTAIQEAADSATDVMPPQHGSSRDAEGSEGSPHHRHGCTTSLPGVLASTPSPSLFQFPTLGSAPQHPPAPSASSSSQLQSPFDSSPSHGESHLPSRDAHSRSISRSPRLSPSQSPSRSPLRSPARAPITTIPLATVLDPTPSPSPSSPDGSEFNVSIWRSEEVLMGGALQVRNMSVCVASTEPRQLSHEEMADLGRVAVGGRLLEATLRFLAANAPAHSI